MASHSKDAEDGTTARDPSVVSTVRPSAIDNCPLLVAAGSVCRWVRRRYHCEPGRLDRSHCCHLRGLGDGCRAGRIFMRRLLNVDMKLRRALLLGSSPANRRVLASGYTSLRPPTGGCLPALLWRTRALGQMNYNFGAISLGPLANLEEQPTARGVFSAVGHNVVTPDVDGDVIDRRRGSRRKNLIVCPPPPLPGPEGHAKTLTTAAMKKTKAIACCGGFDPNDGSV